MVLLGDVDRLHLLVHPGGLLGVALHDGEHQHVEGGVGKVQDLPPHLGCQQTHLLVNILRTGKVNKIKIQSTAGDLPIYFCVDVDGRYFSEAVLCLLPNQF